MRQTPHLFVALAFLTSMSAACGGSVAPTPSSEKSTGTGGTGSDVGTPPPGSGSGSAASSSGSTSGTGGTGPSTQPLLPAIDASVVRIALASAFLGAIPSCPSAFGPGGPSAPEKMTYDRGTHVATWNACDPAQKAFVDSSRTLTDAEVTAIEADLAAIRYVSSMKCDGYDGSITTMTTYSAGDTNGQLYADDNINCYTDGRRYANVRTVFGDLSKLRTP